MMCKHPYSPEEGVHVGCGSCLFCRINRSRVWAHRLLCENFCWEASCFATLTYDEMFLPDKFVDKHGREWPEYSVNPRALQLFMKRLRRKMEPIRIRFYGVGEYGDPEEDTLHGKGRPHYHVALFGVGQDYGFCDERKEVVCKSLGDVVESSWPCGFVHIGEINKDSARYITNYVTKFMNFSRSKKLKGRHPEFARMSNRPCGIGAPYMVAVADQLLAAGYSKDKIVSELMFGNKKLPLGSYLQEKLHQLRKGDVCASFRESRARLFELGVEYVGWAHNERLSHRHKRPYKDMVHSDQLPERHYSVRDYHLRKSAPKRHTIEGHERLFRKRSVL